MAAAVAEFVEELAQLDRPAREVDLLAGDSQMLATICRKSFEVVPATPMSCGDRYCSGASGAPAVRASNTFRRLVM